MSCVVCQGLIQGKRAPSSRSRRQQQGRWFAATSKERRSGRGNLVYRPPLGTGVAPPTSGSRQSHQPATNSPKLPDTVTAGGQDSRVAVGGVGPHRLSHTHRRHDDNAPVPVSRGLDNRGNDLSMPVTKKTSSATMSVVSNLATTPVVVSSASQRSRTVETIVSKAVESTRVVKETPSSQGLTSPDHHRDAVNARKPLGLFIATVAPHRKRRRSKSRSLRSSSSPKKPRQ